MAASFQRPLSARLVARQVSELLMARTRRWQPLVPHERLPSMVFGVVLGASIAHRPYRDLADGCWIGIEAARTLGRPVTATAIAHSMSLPLTTVRRRAAELVDAALLVRGKAGFSVDGDFFASDALSRVAVEDAGDLACTLSALADAGYAPAAVAIRAGVQEVPPGVIERLLLAFTLRALETFTELYDDVTAGTIVAAITAANIRHVTEDPDLARRYAGEDMPPPDAIREPISLRALARSIDLPFETVRRRVNGLIATGVIVPKGDGVIVPAQVLLAPRFLENNRRITLHFEQMLDALALLTVAGRG